MRPDALFPLLLPLYLLLTTSVSVTKSATFTCTASNRCQAMIGYTTPNDTAISAIRDLFGIKSLRSLLASNSWPPSTAQILTVHAGSTVRIPIPCICRDGTGTSNRRPIYTVVEHDTMDTIAKNTFLGFVTFEEITAVNNISDPDLIQIGEKLWIPLPCSCDDVDGTDVVHYGHMVTAGSTTAQIAEQFGTTQETLLRLNGMDDPSNINSGAILDIPLKACSSSIINTSLDGSLLIPNASYALTANNCVQCSCDSSDWQLKCNPARGVKVLKWSECPSMQCEGTGNLQLGDALPLGACQLATCAYAGYTEEKILTNLTTRSTCPNVGAPRMQPFDNSADGRLGLQGLTWIALTISLGTYSVALWSFF